VHIINPHPLVSGTLLISNEPPRLSHSQRMENGHAHGCRISFDKRAHVGVKPYRTRSAKQGGVSM